MKPQPNQPRLRSVMLMLFILLQSFSSISQIDKLEKGIIHNNVSINGDNNESYSLYLPNAYDSAQQWPILYIFDPVARGILGVQTFQEAAEQYGYILACSNNSSNGLIENNFKIASNLFAETLEKLAIDTARIYATGFSGGARLSFALAMNKPLIKGVIGCGSGFPGNKPFTKTSFFYIGIVGDLDMNYLELKKVEKWMDHLGSKNHLIVFEGIHKWPPKEAILESFNWIEYDRMKQNKIPIDQAKIDREFTDLKKKANALFEDGKKYESYGLTQRTIKRFDGLTNINELEQLQNTLDSDKKFQKELKKIEGLDKKEVEWRNHYIGLMKKQLATPVDTFLTTWKKDFAVLDRTTKKKDIRESKAAQRAVSAIRAWCIETGQFSSSQGNYATAISVNVAWLAVRPNDAWAHFRIARYYAGSNKTSKALQHLKKSIGGGFNNKKWIQSVPEFKTLEKNDKFVKLLSAMK